MSSDTLNKPLASSQSTSKISGLCINVSIIHLIGFIFIIVKVYLIKTINKMLDDGNTFCLHLRKI